MKVSKVSWILGFIAPERGLTGRIRNGGTHLRSINSFEAKVKQSNYKKDNFETIIEVKGALDDTKLLLLILLR